MGTEAEGGLLAQIVNFPRRFRRITEGEYRPEIDGLRFFAIAIVIIGHFLERYERWQNLIGRGLISQSTWKALVDPGAGVELSS